MFEKILLSVASPDEGPAITTACALAAAAGSEIVVFHVHQHESGRAAAWDIETQGEANAVVNAVQEDLKKRGAKVTSTLVHDGLSKKTAHAIVEAAQEAGCGVIVVGARRLSAVQALLLGSVARETIEVSDRPVLVAR